MNLTIWNNHDWGNRKKMVLIALLCAAGTTNTARANKVIDITKRVMLAMPHAVQKRTAKVMHTFSSLKEEGTRWRLRLLVQEFLAMNDKKPLAEYIDEFIAIVRDNPEYFKELLFSRAFKENTPDQDELMTFILERFEKVKHSKNIAYIKAMLYLPIRQWIRKNTVIPTNKHAERALRYHASFNKG